MSSTQRSRTARISTLACCAAIAVAALAPQTGVGGEVREELSRPLEIRIDEAAAAARTAGGEVLYLSWRFRGFFGALAGLFVPSHGDGLLTFVPREEGRVEIQLLLTAPGRGEEYFLYGAEIDRDSRTTEAVWSAYAFRGRSKQREQEVENSEVVDFASAIYHLRWHPPTETLAMTIWSGGKTYPAEIEPLEPERRKVGGEPTAVRGYAVRGTKIDGQPSFKDKYFLYFTPDDRAAPMEIIGKRGLVRVEIELVDAEGPTASAPDHVRSAESGGRGADPGN